MRSQPHIVPLLNFKSHPLFFVSHTSALTANEFIMYRTPILQKKLPQIYSSSVNDLPFFCAMECKVRQHTNIWIKLRAGNDDSYIKMITPSK